MSPRILIAGVGNLFYGDDAFGSEVARRLAQTPLPANVRVVDFGIRGHDLAFALEEDYHTVVLVDVIQRGGIPGEIYLIETDLENAAAATPYQAMDTHGMHPWHVVGMIQARGGKLPRVLLVGCEPLTFGPEEGVIGLSPPVEAAVREAVARIHSLLHDCEACAE